MKKFLYLLSALVLSACAGEKTVPVLHVEGGDIQGVTTEKEGVYVYKGIPYAAPPIGENRWRAPQPVVAWEGVRMCDKFGHPAFQAAHYPGGYTTEWGYGDEAPYREDCLYLNVYTKAPGQTDKKLPVAFWIFGGGLREGWGSEPEFDGKEWAAKDVVLVTFNYRVGPFGFFAHPEISAEDPEHATGNWGTLDQIAALKWVKNNIAQFGGDPDNVMIFGQSAGSRSVKFLSASPLTEGLFNKAVVMSGSGLVDPRASGKTVSAGGRMTSQGHLTLEQAEKSIKEVMDWAGLTDLKKMRAASTETIYALGTVYTSVTGKRSALSAMPIAPYLDNYVLPITFVIPLTIPGIWALRLLISASIAKNLDKERMPTSLPVLFRMTALIQKTISRVHSTLQISGMCSNLWSIAGDLGLRAIGISRKECLRHGPILPNMVTLTAREKRFGNLIPRTTRRS